MVAVWPPPSRPGGRCGRHRRHEGSRRVCRGSGYGSGSGGASIAELPGRRLALRVLQVPTSCPGSTAPAGAAGVLGSARVPLRRLRRASASAPIPRGQDADSKRGLPQAPRATGTGQVGGFQGRRRCRLRSVGDRGGARSGGGRRGAVKATLGSGRFHRAGDVDAAGLRHAGTVRRGCRGRHDVLDGPAGDRSAPAR